MGSLRRAISDVECYGFTVESVVKHYLEWVVIPFYYIITGWNKGEQKQEYKAIRSAKRGDPRYAEKTLRRFDKAGVSLVKKVGKEEFFSRKERDRSRISSPLVFVTLTYERLNDLKVCWVEVGKDYNRWITGLRRRFGKVSVVRCFESHDDGWVHIHVLLCFQEVTWQGFRWDRWIRGYRRVTFRVDRFEEIKEGWRGGFSDVQLMNSAVGGYDYAKKYIVKACDLRATDSKVTKTLALSWFFHKRSFSISGDICATYSDLINQHSNSNGGICFKPHFNGLDGSVIIIGVEEWGLYGIVPDCQGEIEGEFVDLSLKRVCQLELMNLIKR